VQIFSFSFSSVCTMGFTLVSLLSSSADVRASYHSKLVLPTFGIFFGIIFSACFHGGVTCTSMVVFRLILGCSKLLLLYILCVLLASFNVPSRFYFLISLPMVGSCLRHLQNVIWFSMDE
jgi:hypothetical protein